MSLFSILYRTIHPKAKVDYILCSWIRESVSIGGCDMEHISYHFKMADGSHPCISSFWKDGLETERHIHNNKEKA